MLTTREWFEMDIPSEVLEAFSKKLPSDPILDLPDVSSIPIEGTLSHPPLPPQPTSSGCQRVTLDPSSFKVEQQLMTTNQTPLHCCPGIGYETPTFNMTPDLRSPHPIPISSMSMTMTSNEISLTQINLCCDICGMTLATKSTLKRHRMIHLKHHCETLKSYSPLEQVPVEMCEVTQGPCQRKPTTMTITGTGSIHTDPVYECRFCTKKFNCKRQRSSHIRNHTVERPYQCQKCFKLFSRPDHLVRHLLIHSGEKPFKCQSCTSAFNQKAYLEKHRRRVHLV